MGLPQATLDRIAAKKAEEAAKASSPIPNTARNSIDPALAAEWSQYKEAIPNNELVRPKDDTERAIDERVESLGVLEAYRLYIRKMDPQPGGKTESIMLSCPLPSHPDKHPSAWANTDNNTWFCGSCQIGGDQFDLAAIGHGFDLATYKEGTNWGNLRREIAKDLGLQVEFVPGLGYTAYQATEYKAPNPPPVYPGSGTTNGRAHDRTGITQALQAEQPTLPNEYLVVEAAPADEEETLAKWDKSDADVPSLEWKTLVPQGTFLDCYMRACVVDDVPEEFHFWHGMAALGLAAGRNVFLVDSPPVYSNLFLVLMGRTGIGKSKSKGYMTAVLREVFPYDDGSRHGSTGVKIVPVPGSAEALVWSFQHPEYGDPSNPKIVTGYAPVKGLVEFSEFKGLVQRIGRTGNTLDTTLIDFYDASPEITRRSQSGGTLTANKPFCTVLSTVQPEVLSTLLNEADEDSGFLNRWLFVGGPRKEKQIFNKAHVDLSAAVLEMFNLKLWTDKLRHVRFTNEAEEFFTERWRDTIKNDVESSGNAFSRIDLTLKKLALTFAINEKRTEIDLELFSRVWSMYDYLKGYTSMKSHNMNQNKYVNYEETCLLALEKIGRPASAREILRKMSTRKRESAEFTTRTCKSLVDAGTLQPIKMTPGSKGGRPTAAYWFADKEIPE